MLPASEADGGQRAWGSGPAGLCTLSGRSRWWGNMTGTPQGRRGHRRPTPAGGRHQTGGRTLPPADPLHSAAVREGTGSESQTTRSQALGCRSSVSGPRGGSEFQFPESKAAILHSWPGGRLLTPAFRPAHAGFTAPWPALATGVPATPGSRRAAVVPTSVPRLLGRFRAEAPRGGGGRHPGL